MFLAVVTRHHIMLIMVVLVMQVVVVAEKLSLAITNPIQYINYSKVYLMIVVMKINIKEIHSVVTISVLWSTSMVIKRDYF